MKILDYLASPYSHPDSEVQKQRFETACRVAGELLSKGLNVFSPIAHSHPIHLVNGVRGDWEFWKRLDFLYLELTRCLYVLTIPGWSESAGVLAEIEEAKRLGIPVKYIDELCKEVSA